MFDIFEKAFQLLQALLTSSIPFDKRKLLTVCTNLNSCWLFFFLLADQEDRTKDAVLNLLLKCLSYDFAGTTLDEAGEDTGTVQVSPFMYAPIKHPTHLFFY